MLIGHQRIWNFLIKSAARNKLAHAYLFVGPAQVGKLTLAREFGQWLFCEKNTLGYNLAPSLSFKRRGQDMAAPCGQCRACLSIEKNQNPDFFVLSAKQTDKNDVIKQAEIGIKEARDLQHQLSLSPYGAPYKTAIIEEASALSGEAVSALLKTLEEPSSKSLIILISSSWQAVLPTIVSRCQTVKFLPVTEKEMLEKLKNFNPPAPPFTRGVKKEDVFTGGTNTGLSSVNEGGLQKAIKLAAGRPGLAISILRDANLLVKQEEAAGLFEKILKLPLARRWEQAEKMSENLIEARDIMDQWLLWLRDKILESNGLAKLVLGAPDSRNAAGNYKIANLLSACREIQKTRDILLNPSFNGKLALEVMMTKI